MKEIIEIFKEHQESGEIAMTSELYEALTTAIHVLERVEDVEGTAKMMKEYLLPIPNETLEIVVKYLPTAILLATLMGYCIGKSEKLREMAREFKRGWDDEMKEGV